MIKYLSWAMIKTRCIFHGGKNIGGKRPFPFIKCAPSPLCDDPRVVHSCIAAATNCKEYKLCHDEGTRQCAFLWIPRNHIKCKDRKYIKKYSSIIDAAFSPKKLYLLCTKVESDASQGVAAAALTRNKEKSDVFFKHSSCLKCRGG